MPSLAPWLLRYWRNSAPRSAMAIADDIAPLFLNCMHEHRTLAADAGCEQLLRADGWLHLYHKGPIPAATMQGVARARKFGMRVDILDSTEIATREPRLREKFATGIQWRDAGSVSDPGELSRRLAATFSKRGGTIARGDAMTLHQKGSGWALDLPDGSVQAENAVIALGPWAEDLARRFGYRFPLAVKRGYHMHYALPTDLTPRLPVIDVDNGFVLSPMTGGMRLTTAIEFAHRDAPPNPRQIDRAEIFARAMFDLGPRLDTGPWMGSRPCTSDMRPIIGPAPRHKGLWFACGHAHHGLTLGPVTGRLLAEQMCGETPFIPAQPFWPSRFGRA